ncbi:hypothetical protein ACQEVX_35585 [Streptomyces syringium]
MRAIGWVLALGALDAVVATPFLAHSRALHDRSRGCWWCRPRLLPCKRR